jgi:imidazolonepropionase-like amidohydrolase
MTVTRHLLPILFFLFCHLTLAQRTALMCGGLIDVEEGVFKEDQVIFIEGERIVGFGKQTDIEPEDSVIDLTAMTVLPGLIDAHVHPLIHGDEYQLNHMKESSAFKALFGLSVVQQWLSEGWTTIRVAGDADVQYAHFAIRDAINAGLFTGPRIFGAGHYLSVTGGGGDINYLAPEQDVIADGLIVDGPEEIRKAVRQEIKYGSDWIKLLVTGAFMSSGDNPQSVHFSDEELEVVMEEANNRGVPVMAHAHATAGIKKAIQMGVRSIEHGTFLDEEAIDMFVETGTYLVPTMYVGEYFIEEHKDSEALAKAIELHIKYREPTREMLKKAISRGVKIGVGSDNVGFPPYFAAREISLLVELGMSPIEAIQAATIVNAELLMKEEEIGSLEVGKYADIIAVPGNPLNDIDVLQEVAFVMKGGEVILR